MDDTKIVNVARLEIHLDAEKEPVFTCGELITGKLLIELRKPMKIKMIKVQMKGRAVWLNNSSEKDDNEKVFFDKELTLLECPPGKPQPGSRWSGDFVLPFECKLPKKCPTTYEGPHAFIRYTIRASVVQGNKSKPTHEYYVTKALTVVSPSKGLVVTGRPAVAQDSATLGRYCFKSRLIAELSLSKTGYLPGEGIYGTLKIGREHPIDILDHMEVCLVDRVRRIDAPEKSAVSPWRTLLVRKMESTLKTRKQITGAIQQNGLFLLVVPPVRPSITEDYKDSPDIPFFKIEYGIQVTLGTHILLEIPIQIGELSTRAYANTLEEFITGSQSIEEADEEGKTAVNGPFVYTPVYPYPYSTNNETDGKFSRTMTAKKIMNVHMGGPFRVNIVNGDSRIAEEEMTTIETSSDEEESVKNFKKLSLNNVVSGTSERNEVFEGHVKRRTVAIEPTTNNNDEKNIVSTNADRNKSTLIH